MALVNLNEVRAAWTRRYGSAYARRAMADTVPWVPWTPPSCLAVALAIRILTTTAPRD